MSPILSKSLALSATGASCLAAMITSEQISTWFQFGTMAGIVVVAFMNRMDARKALAVATKTSDTTDKIHTLSNSNMSAQLRIVMLQAKRIAELTKAQSDADIAVETERAYNEHLSKQFIVDQREQTKP